MTRSLTTDQAARLRHWIDNLHRLHQLVAELHDLAVEQAEAERHPASK